MFIKKLKQTFFKDIDAISEVDIWIYYVDICINRYAGTQIKELS